MIFSEQCVFKPLFYFYFLANFCCEEQLKRHEKRGEAIYSDFVVND